MSTTNSNAASIIQSPNDYLDKGINELIQHNSLVRMNNKTIVDLIAGLGILIGANLVKNIMVGLITDNQKHIQTMFLNSIGLINLANASHIAQFAWSTTFGRLMISHHQKLMPVVIDNEHHSHVIHITLTPHLIETLLFVLDKSKTCTIDGIDKITFNCNVSSNIDVSTAHEIMLHYIYTNITFHYQSSQIYIERLVTNANADKSSLTMFEILSKKYDNFNYDAFSKELEMKCDFSRSTKSMSFRNKFNSFGVFENSTSQFIHNVIWKYVSNDEIKHASEQQMNTIAIHLMLLIMFVANSSRYALLVNSYISAKYNVYEKTTDKLLIGHELVYFNSSVHSGWHEYNRFVEFIGRSLTEFQLFTNLFCYKPPNTQQNTQQNKTNSGNFDALITVNGIADEMECYHRLKTFMCHLQTISKRQNQNNKINVKTVNFVDKTVDGTPNPSHQTYIEQKKQMLSEKTSLADVISILGPEPDKMVGSSVSREINSETVCEKYCSFDNLYLRKNQEAMLYQLVESFQNDKQEMAELGIPNKLGILLHGDPGCGKTTTILTIASYFGRDVFYVNLKSVKTNEELKDVFNYVNAKHVGGGIIVFEDIDAMTDATRRRTSNDVIETNGITLEYLLNLLDGMLTFNDSIVVITTNHLEHLDPALYRAGRIDKLIELKKCDRHQIGKIFRRFMKREICTDVLCAIPEDVFCPAEIIFHLKMYVKCRDIPDKEIMSLFIV